jgi:hypothetical protein
VLPEPFLNKDHFFTSLTRLRLRNPNRTRYTQVKTGTTVTIAKWAVIHALMFLAWMLMERLAGFHSTRLQQQPVVGVLILIPSIIIYVLALLDVKRNHCAGQLSWKQGFTSGCLFTAFIVVLSPLNHALTAYVVSPDYFANMTAFTVDQNILTPEQAAQQFSLGNYVVTGIIAGLATGVIFSAAIALFTRSKTVAA